MTESAAACVQGGRTSTSSRTSTNSKGAGRRAGWAVRAPQGQPSSWRSLLGVAVTSLSVTGLAVAITGAAVGCGGRSIGPDGNQNNTGQDAGVPPRDAAADVDAAPLADAGTCAPETWWELTPTPLTRVEVLTPWAGGDGIPEGTTVRVAATVTVTGCDEPAGVVATPPQTPRTVLLEGYTWAYHGPRACPHESREDTELLAISDADPGEWHLVDMLVNGPDTTFWVRACSAEEDCMCLAWQGVPGDWGSSCEHDCQCVPGLGCVEDGPGSPTCYQSCSTSADCPMPLFCNHFLPSTPEGVCLSTGLLDACQSSADCEPGFACLPAEGLPDPYCQAAMATQPVGRSCNFDCDCPAGFSCVSQNDPGAGRTCQIRCRGDRDCPQAMQCDLTTLPFGYSVNQLTCQFNDAL